ncbi:MAG: carboxypeptidase-like regulatory domain-containing protein, partial [Thermoplasmata archaeon]
LDREQRKVYVDNCQKVFYQDSVYIILAYVYQTYAWRTDRFDGWGDWGAHPGRTVDNFWTGNPLYFDLMPVPPPTGYVVGLTLDSAGYEVPNCDIIITNLRTGAFNYTRSSSISGYYEFDLNSMSGGWQDGDLIRVFAYKTPLGLMGQNESAIDADVGYVRIDVTLTSSQPIKPFYVSGQIIDMEGNEVPNCDIVITNTRTGAFNFTRSNASGHYQFDLNMMDGKWEDSDVIRVLAFNSTLMLMGENESAIDASAGELIIDVTMAGVIPEFQSILIPVTGLMIAVITVMVARRRRRR